MDSGIRSYLDRYVYQDPIIPDDPPVDLGIVVVVPAYDEPDVLDTLASLSSCILPPCGVEVLVVINHPDKATRAVKKRSAATYDKVQDWLAARSQVAPKIHTTTPIGLPSKHAGVGLARKIGMDEAVWRFYRAGKQDGLIVNLDADCTIAPNYLQTLHNTILLHNDLNGCTIYFEHPLQGLKAPMLDHIVDYELHLRYHNISLSLAQYPFAFHTIGSSMGVTVHAYTSQGGMNKRKAGEDFYFLHKIFPLGGFYAVNGTTVYPKARLSDKVPFGTGAALTKLSEGRYPGGWPTYHPESYRLLGLFLSRQKELFQADRKTVANLIRALPECIHSYLEQQHAVINILRITQTTTVARAFDRAFYRWFDGLKVLRFFNYAARHHYPNIEVTQATSKLIKQLAGVKMDPADGEAMLHFLRMYERQEGQTSG